ncbi:hypothetical protein [Risungbinella massiliensis]|uniref:hypothetical protein n=1 Tax=Risungbinella massiliensis TaxID=1329796 RepID=UPI0005CBEC8E|nr:hypothetical protein [Risungbinella massiliensis]
MKSYTRFWLECSLVLASLISLKTWVFPFFISIWFPTNDLASLMMEWTVIMTGIVTLFLYFSLGSVAKQVYRFRSNEASLVLAVLHLPLFFPLLGVFSDEWQRLLTDLFSLFSFNLLDWPGSQIWICWSAFLLGRKIKIMEKEKNVFSDKVKQEAEMN